MGEILLDIKNLCVDFKNQRVVNHVSLSVFAGETLAIVGESGSGKSLTALAILGLLPPTARTHGSIMFEGENLLQVTPTKLRSFCGNSIAMIFQEPMTSLNPVLTIGEQIEETVRLHRDVSRKSAKAMTLDALEEVGIPSKRYKSYPHEFSGGMRQRVMIAMALICEPMLLIADEPTTALDATTSRNIMQLLLDIKTRRAMSMLFISHDLKLVASIADNVCVMRSGTFVEQGVAVEVLRQPTHPYTQELVSCLPSMK
jgi:ABC-type glutathione transport system ATPase component